MNFHLAATEGLIQAQMTLEKAGGKAMQFSNTIERVRALYQPVTQLGGRNVIRANPCKNRPKSPIRGKVQKIKIALLLQTSRH